MEIVTESAVNLAWIGDAVMTLRIREHLLEKGYTKANILQRKSALICSAKGQAKILERLENEGFFCSEEETILHRGRNATIRSKAKNADGKTYLQATALEALLGYLYLYHHEERLKACLERIIQEGDNL